jgi:hypothetical protein
MLIGAVLLCYVVVRQSALLRLLQQTQVFACPPGVSWSYCSYMFHCTAASALAGTQASTGFAQPAANCSSCCAASSAPWCNSGLMDSQLPVPWDPRPKSGWILSAGTGTRCNWLRRMLTCPESVCKGTGVQGAGP